MFYEFFNKTANEIFVLVKLNWAQLQIDLTWSFNSVVKQN